jgi:hypothetical protein
MMHRSAIGEAAAAAARTGTVAVNDADADYVVLKRLVAALPTDRSSLRYAIVYKAATLLDKAPPANCLASAEAGGSGVANCNVYQRAVVIAPDPARFGYDPTVAPAATADQNWPARIRHSDYSAGSDLIGVFVSTDYRSISGVIPKHRYTANAVLPLESRAV